MKTAESKTKSSHAKNAVGSPTKGLGEPLTAKQQRFVDEYLIDLNATQAAIRTGYAAGSADVTGARLLGNARIKAAIDAGRAKTAEKLQISRERVLSEYMKLAFCDPRKFFKDDGTVKHPTELDDETAAALSSFEVLEEFAGQGNNRFQIGDTKKVKWTDKKAALDSIARMMGFNQDKMVLEGNPDNPIQLMMQQIGGTKFAVKE